MAEIDPVIFEFHARVNGYLADINRTTTQVDQKIGLQEKRVKSLERTFAQSSSAISGQLRGLAGTLAAAFSGRELMGLIDNFTRLQNSLRVAGLEGENLASVQSDLLAIAQRYGVSINSLADLYGKATQSGADLGAGQAQILALTEATSQSLLITGTSAQQASGAILGLTQALASGTVRAEEFNQMNEGGLAPLLKAAAASERFGGSIGKLRQAVVDGKVTSEEFYRSVLANSQLLSGQAAKATLTLSGAFTQLRNQMTVYFGEASKTNGATAALAEAISGLADNLDVLIPALAIIATAIGGRLVAGMVAATGAASASSAAVFAFQARMAGAATTAEALALTSRAAGASMLAAFGGPVGLAITAIAVGIGYVATQAYAARQELAQLESQTQQLAKQSDAIEKSMRAAGVAIDTAGDKARGASSYMDQLADSIWNATQRALELARSLGAAKLVELNNQLSDVRERRSRLRSGGMPGVATASDPSTALPSPLAWLDYLGDPGAKDSALGRQEAELVRQIELRTQAMAAGVKLLDEPTAPKPAATGGGKGDKGRRGGASGPSAADISRRFNNELVGLAQQALSSMAAVTEDADLRAELELRGVELARLRNLEDIKSNAAYFDAKKKEYTAMGQRLVEATEAGAERERERIEYERKRAVDAKTLELKLDALDDERATLEAQARAADTLAERRELERRILKIQQEIERAALEEQIAQGKILDAKNARANLEKRQAAQTATLNNEQAGPLAQWARGMSEKSLSQRGEELVVREIQSLREGMNSAIQNALGIQDDFFGGLISILLDQILFQPLADALSKGAGGGGGLFGNILGGLFGGIFGRASGGSVTGGQMYRINEGASPGRVEGFIPQGSGTIIPLGQMNQRVATGGESGGQIQVNVTLSEDLNAKIDIRLRPEYPGHVWSYDFVEGR